MTSEQEIVFVGEPSVGLQRRVQREIRQVIAFYSDRYGVVVPEFTLYVAEDLEPVADLYRELHGRDPPIEPGFGGGWVTSRRGSAIEAFIAADSEWALIEVLAHEYYHMMQSHLVRSGADGPRSSPAWLIEGTAEFGETRYNQRDSPERVEYLWRWEPLARSERPFETVFRNEEPFRELGLGGVVNAALEPYLYGFAASGVAWLVAHSGNDRADLEYWRLLAETDDWESAFASSFGITPDDFLAAFEADRSATVRAQPQIRGRVVDLEGAPLAGVHIGVSPQWRGALAVTTSGEDGAFAVKVLPEWSYRISLGRVAGGSRFAGVFYGYSFDPETGHVNGCGGDPFLEVGRESVENLVIPVRPDLLTRPDDPPCNEGLPGHHVISGVITGPDGERILGGSVGVCAVNSDDRNCSRTSMDGTFRVVVRNGPTALEINREYRPGEGISAPIGWYAEGGMVRDERDLTRIRVDGAGVAGIEIRLPAAPGDIPFLGDGGVPPLVSYVQGVVLAPDGEPVRGLEVGVSIPDSTASWSTRTGAEGDFIIAADHEYIELFVRHERCGIFGYYDGAGGLLGTGSRTAIGVGDVPLTGVVIALPIDPRAPCVDDGSGWWSAPEGGLYRISGVVLGPDGDPREGVHLWADGGRGSQEIRDETGADGTFTLLAPPGWYKLDVTVFRREGAPRSGWYGGESGFTVRQQQITLVAVDDEDISGLVIHLPEFR